MQYFYQCKTLEEVKATYKKLAMKHHPDLGGCTTTMQAINKEYAFASAKIVNGSGLNVEDTEKEMKFSEEYRAVIEKIIHLDGITIELVGFWIWVTGNTYPVRSNLKNAGLLFASKKLAWYYRSEEFKQRGGKKSLEEIRDRYGSEILNKTAKRKKLIN